MNQEIKKQWVDALINYSTIPNTERHKDIYHSSLKAPYGGQLSPDGILCALYLNAHNIPWENKDKMACLGTTHAIPKEVQEWAGLKTHDPILKSAPDKFLFVGYKNPTLNTVSAICKKRVGEIWANISYADVASLIQSDL